MRLLRPHLLNPRTEGGARPERPNRVLNRAVGLMLFALGLLIAAAVALVPIPEFDELDVRTGTLIDVRRERYSPCRRGDCLRTMITVRHDGAATDYHFADTDTTLFRPGDPITVRTHREIRGLDGVRVWHAEQAGRVLRDHASEAAVDRRIRLVLVLLMPFAVGGGWWILRRYDWGGRRVPRPGGAAARSS